jgi:quinol monooxygenase YgiN
MINMKFAPRKMDEALQILRSIVERIRAEAGCVSCSVYHDTEAEQEIVFMEKWRTEDDFQHHLRSEEYKKILLIMEMAQTQPEISFETIISTRGIEIIEKARAGKE